MYILHSVRKKEFNIENNLYGHESLKKCGYIHCSDLDTYGLVAPNFKDDIEERLLLVINTDKVIPDIKWEDGGGYDFPHIYGLLNVDSIEEIFPHLWSTEKEWIPNEKLKDFGFRGTIKTL